ncbi:MAG: divalent-cation tolerance protein CutA [Alphaproteobacteria bacterium]|jgi:periplasmic divalent cation tolerance protein|nr:divalent-cation tolerance protein CutA [Rhodospirillaceae bacterium]MDP6031890.1 divalent-cation tolerance protein CutA [Alphaproteobacteria bacterium]MDP7190257.1 divalent-cation tolerance protein CutA [Alphaproteobacteria bacterium]|tara:strand:- start:1099 stop:1413 length:315 start_codon:yes stop_codon:yes gene_type:complete
MEFRFIYITAGSESEARAIAAALVEERLAACVNIIPGMRSIYHWEGKIEETDETILIAKTIKNSVPAIIGRVRELHSYDCPCVASLSIEDGNPQYLDWLARETA